MSSSLCLSSAIVNQRQNDLELDHIVFRIAGCRLPAVLLSDGADYRKSDSGSAGLPAAGLVSPEKTFKELIRIRSRKAVAIIPYTENQVPALLLQHNTDKSIFFRVLNRIVKKQFQHLPVLFLRSVDLNPGRHIGPDLNPAQGGTLPEQLQRIQQELRCIEECRYKYSRTSFLHSG